MARVTEARRAQMREQRRSSLQDQCQISAAVEGANATHGQAHTWPAVTSTVDCTVSRKPLVSGGEGMELSIAYQWEVIVLDDVTINERDHITPISGPHIGKTFEAYDVTPPGSFDFTHRIRVTEIDGV